MVLDKRNWVQPVESFTIMTNFLANCVQRNMHYDRNQLFTRLRNLKSTNNEKRNDKRHSNTDLIYS